MRNTAPLITLAVAATLYAAAGAAQSEVKQVVKPPISQAWIDVATFSGFGMQMGMGGAGGAGSMMNAPLSALMGGGKGRAEFGYTQYGSTGRWMDVTLYTSRNPSLAEALQSVPQATTLAPTLKLMTPEKPKPAPKVDSPDEEQPADWDYEPPKGKLIMYWGCSETVKPGQPKVVDLSTATVGDLAKFFESRRATKRGTHATFGRPVWPSKDDKRALPQGASIAGEHAFKAQGVPESFRFTIPAAQDLMPEIKLKQTTQANGSVLLEWNAIPYARAYFLATMGGLPNEDEAGMVIWTSSELPDSGMGLFDYQTNAAVDKWLREKVLLPPTTTRCAIPKDAATPGMLRAIAYGTELNMAYPPRPTDPKIPWEPDWNLKIRVKSMTTSMLGMSGEGMPGAGGADESDLSEATAPPEGGAGTAAPSGEPPKKKSRFEMLKEAAKEAAKQVP